MATVDTHEVALLRLVAQHLAGPPAANAVDAVRGLLAAQGQDLPAALLSMALRTSSRSTAAVREALEVGGVVRSWPLRGTLHLVAADDLPWLLDLTGRRAVAREAPLRAARGPDERVVARAGEVAEEVLERRSSGPVAAPREELATRWAAAGLDVAGPGATLLLRELALRGVLCLGPVRERAQLVVLVRDWVPAARHLDREEALGELAVRYLRGHGPASAADLVRWSGLTATDVRTGIALARPRLGVVDVGGVEHLLDPRVPDLLDAARREARAVLLVPAFDELVLGYADRTATVAAEHAERIVPGGNGIFRPVVVEDGRAVGTWRLPGRGSRTGLGAEPFTGFSPDVQGALPGLEADLLAVTADDGAAQRGSGPANRAT